MKIAAQAFIAIEQTLAKTLKVRWDKIAHEMLAKLNVLLEERRYSEAHAAVARLSMRGLVEEVRPKIEELAVSALLFGAHHVAGTVRQTSYMQGHQLPLEMRGATASSGMDV